MDKVDDELPHQEDLNMGNNNEFITDHICEEKERDNDRLNFDNININNNGGHQVYKTEMIRETTDSAVLSLKLLCQRVFKNVNYLEKIFNVKSFDKKKMTKEEFVGISSFSAYTEKLKIHKDS